MATNYLHDIKNCFYHVNHCRSEPIINVFEYIWNINQFWETSKLVSQLYSGYNKEQPLTFRMDILKNENKLQFYAILSVESSTASYGFVELKTTTNETLFSSEIRCKLKNDMFLFEVPTSLFREDEEDFFFLPENTLIVCFKLHILKTMSQICISENIPPSYKVVQEHILPSAINDSVITFVMDNRCLSISKLLLCSKSSIFYSMFANNQENLNDKIHITDTNFEIICMFLEFIETSIAPDLNTDLKEIQELLKIAVRYDVRDLSSICIHYLMKRISIDNAVEFLNHAYTYNLDSLIKFIKRFILIYYKEIVCTPNFLMLMQKYPELAQINNQRVSLARKANYTC